MSEIGPISEDNFQKLSEVINKDFMSFVREEVVLENMAQNTLNALEPDLKSQVELELQNKRVKLPEYTKEQIEKVIKERDELRERLEEYCVIEEDLEYLKRFSQMNALLIETLNNAGIAIPELPKEVKYEPVEKPGSLACHHGSFVEVLDIEDYVIDIYINNSDLKLLAVALKAVPKLIKERFTSNMTTKQKVAFQEIMDNQGPLKLTDVTKAQEEVLKQMKPNIPEGTND
jgi:hypothetical protein